MTVTLALLAAHVLADFPLQTDRMAAEKFDSAKVRLFHSSVHWLTTTVLLSISGVDYTMAALAGNAVLAFHFLIDTRRWASPKDGFVAYPIAVDQSLHLVTLWLVAVVVL